MKRRVPAFNFLLAILLLSATNVSAQRATVITGRLVGHDGRSMVKAHVHLARLHQSKPIAEIEVAKNGFFRIATTETGLVFVQFTGVDHLEEEIPLYIEQPARFRINARLSHNDYVTDLSRVKIIGDFNDFSSQSAQPMKRQPRGTYLAEFETPKPRFAYQLSGIRKTGGTINGTQSDAYEYDGGGDYRSVVVPANGHVRIVFDPNKLIRDSSAAKVRLEGASMQATRFAALYDEMLKRRKPLSAALAAYRKTGKPIYEFTFDWSPYLSGLSEQIASEKNALLKQMLLIGYLDFGYGSFGAKLDPTLAQEALAKIPARSTLWSIEPDLIGVALRNSGQPNAYADYVQQIIESHPDQRVRNLAKKEYAPNRAVMAGKPVPDFALVSLDDQRTTYTNQALLGKVYMIDFWATWCVPCVEEMGNLHAVYEAYKDRGFDILSLSLDDKPETVKEFRKGKWKMPWLNSFAVGGYQNETVKRFEISGIPKPILVDRAGRIIATGNDLRGANLRHTLALAMNNSQEPQDK
jgi:thiol-disulfide isomerase/thioredoxin